MNRVRAIVIAKDVIRQLADLKVNQGSYVSGKIPTKYMPKNLGKPVTKQFVKHLTKYCKVCALGACFLSHIRRFDGVVAESLFSAYDNDRYRNLVHVYFDRLQALMHEFCTRDLLLIEVAFERDLISSRHTYAAFTTKQDLLAAIYFGMQYTNKTSRLRAIMTNIIRNNGRLHFPVDCYDPIPQSKAFRKLNRQGSAWMFNETEDTFNWSSPK
jgi:hypothetical protein